MHDRPALDHPDVVDLPSLLAYQSGVVSRAQLRRLGWSATELNRALRRGELVTMRPGVYVDHNGPTAWLQQAWGAVLHAWPAALCLTSSLRAAEGPGRRQRNELVVDVAIDLGRRISDLPGVRVHRTPGFAERVQWNLSPPRIRYDESVLDVSAAARSDLDAVAALADAVGARRTTAARLLARLEARGRIRVEPGCKRS